MEYLANLVVIYATENKIGKVGALFYYMCAYLWEHTSGVQRPFLGTKSGQT